MTLLQLQMPVNISEDDIQNWFTIKGMVFLLVKKYGIQVRSGLRKGKVAKLLHDQHVRDPLTIPFFGNDVDDDKKKHLLSGAGRRLLQVHVEGKHI